MKTPSGDSILRGRKASACPALSSALAAIVTIGLAVPAVAQQNQSTKAAAGADADDQLQEITVTATRFAENLNKVPITVTAITGEQLEQRNIQNVDDVFQGTPGVTFYRTMAGGGSNSQIVIRGIQSTTGAGTTGIYIDDTPIQLHKGGISYTAQNGYPDIFDLDRVEVLQGPQGTLFGSGSMGGAVRFISRQPSLDTDSLYVKAEQGFTEDGGASYGGGIAVGGPIINNVLGYRFSADYHMDGGWVWHTSPAAIVAQQAIAATGDTNTNELPEERNSNWRQTYSVRGAVTWAPIDNLTITPSVFYQDIYQNAQSSFYTWISNPSSGDFVNASGVNEPEYDSFILPTLTARYNFTNFSVFSNTSFYNRKELNYYANTGCDIECSPAGPVVPLTNIGYFAQAPYLLTNLHDQNRQQNLQQEFRVASADPSAQFTWQGGVFFQRAVAKSQEFAPLSVSTINGFANAIGEVTGTPYPNYLDLFGIPLLPGNISYQTLDLVTDKHLAAFGEVNYRFFDVLTATLGVRVENVKSSLVSEQAGPYSGNAAWSGFAAEVSQTPVTPKVSIAYQADDDNMIYTTVAKGVRPGGSNGSLPSYCDQALQQAGLSSSTGNYGEDSVWSYELGAKDKFLENRVSIQTSLYWINWTKIQESQFLNTCLHQVTFNGNNLTSKGIAITAQALVTPHMTVSGSFGYDQAKFTQASYGDGGAILINKGDGIDGAPPVTASLAGQYDIPSVFGHSAFLRADAQYTAKENMTAATDPATTAYLPGNFVRPQTLVGNLRAGMNFDRFQTSLFCTNFTNAHPLYQAANGLLGGIYNGPDMLITIRPREIGGTVIYKY
jgi:iron complex outermembrane receptor protein